MITSMIELEVPVVLNLTATDNTLSVDLDDGRTVAVPLAWFPRLQHASQEERNNWRIIGQGHGLHWNDLDEDISIENLLTGRRSGESQQSFARWLASRMAGKKS